MIPLTQAHQLMDSALAGHSAPIETLPLRDATGRVLAADQHSKLDLPPFDKSAMDGYAIGADQGPGDYRVLETVMAGQVGRAALEPGTAVKVMTGAPVPPGTARVVMVEHTEETDGRVKIIDISPGANICPKAEDVRIGDRVAAAGTRLASIDIASLISCGITKVSVFGQLRAAIISTGDEIVDDPKDLAPGRIMNSNGPMLTGLLAEHGFVHTGELMVGDDLDATSDAIASALQSADFVILSGGVSAGDRDFVPHAMKKAGLRIHFRSVAVKPGKPTVFATSQEQPFRCAFGLPGNPVSVLLTFHQFVRRAQSLLFRRDPELRSTQLPMARPYRRRLAERCEFVPCNLTGGSRVQPVTYHGSAHLLAASGADGFFSAPVGITSYEAGDLVDFLPILKGLNEPAASDFNDPTT